MLEFNENISTRQRILRTLLSKYRCTINELAKEVDINPISVRHHISRLEADGLITSSEEKHGRGRPRRNYYLTESGKELFPSRYFKLTIRLLKQLKDTLPASMVNHLFSQMAIDLAGQYSEELVGLSIEEKLNLVIQLLNNEGFNVEWEQKGDQVHIKETNCPYYYVGQNYPEVCSVDQTLISTVLSVPAEKINCMLKGDNHCIYVIDNISKLTQKA